MIVLPDTAIRDALSIAEKLRNKIAEYEFHTAGRKTASFGAGEYTKDLCLKDFLKGVDYALYQAKQLGRNRVANREDIFV